MRGHVVTRSRDPRSRRYSRRVPHAVPGLLGPWARCPPESSVDGHESVTHAS
ncbi:hypothetical protein DB32_007932 [Sandaracinus amylolyticus]|uniref:Uncharacterized protein n=1 Tax=Sandaracinus amylolyticus TaxID=927083 RepID=A0A0F6W9H6_9BACT|nr:hypothetical protein DB32_007932 [Sandaracinus amylolyticus]